MVSSYYRATPKIIHSHDEISLSLSGQNIHFIILVSEGHGLFIPTMPKFWRSYKLFPIFEEYSLYRIAFLLKLWFVWMLIVVYLILLLLYLDLLK